MPADRTLERLNRLDNTSSGEYAQDVANDIRAAMQQHAGVFRTQASMDEGVAKIAAIRERVNGDRAEGQVARVQHRAHRSAGSREPDRVRPGHDVSAAARKECRGAHTVSDYERPADDPVAPLGRDDAQLDEAHALVQRRQPPDLQAGQPEAADGRQVPPKVRTF
jgi:succinate dehydrogenase / fumarate reductase flavoprotein subunit